MLQSQKSLASYFDGPPQAHTSNWYEQTQMMQGGAQLNDWTRNADGKKEYFYPHGADPTKPPAGVTWHEYGKKWHQGEWGYKPEIAQKRRAAQIEAAAKREGRSKIVKQQHDLAMDLFVVHNAWTGQQTEADIVTVVKRIDSILLVMKQEKKEHKATVLAKPAYQGLAPPPDEKFESPEHKQARHARIRARNEEIYSFTTSIDLTKMKDRIATISEYLRTDPKSFDKYEQYMPMHAAGREKNEYHYPVIMTYLRALKHEVMSATKHKLRGSTSAGAKEFIEHSNKAQDQLKHLLKKRKHQKVPKWRPDHAELTALYKHMGERELAMFKFLNPNKEIPKHLVRYTPGWKYEPPKKGEGKKDDKKKGKGKKGKQAQPAQPGQVRKGKKGQQPAVIHVLPPPPPGYYQPKPRQYYDPDALPPNPRFREMEPDETGARLSYSRRSYYDY
jgi:hypothetical protein